MYILVFQIKHPCSSVQGGCISEAEYIINLLQQQYLRQYLCFNICVLSLSYTISVFLLQNGEWLAISPGGVREALFSDEYYTMIWNSRKGFAKVALEAKVVSTICSPSFLSLFFHPHHFPPFVSLLQSCHSSFLISFHFHSLSYFSFHLLVFTLFHVHLPCQSSWVGGTHPLVTPLFSFIHSFFSPLPFSFLSLIHPLPFSLSSSC